MDTHAVTICISEDKGSHLNNQLKIQSESAKDTKRDR